MKIKVNRFTLRAKIPTQATPGSTGFDLYSVEDKIVLPRSSALIKTDTGFKIPNCYFGKVYARSSWAKRFTGVGGGVIDSDCRGAVLVIFFNYSDDFIQINKEDKFAQIAFLRMANTVVFEESKNLTIQNVRLVLVIEPNVERRPKINPCE